MFNKKKIRKFKIKQRRNDYLIFHSAKWISLQVILKACRVLIGNTSSTYSRTCGINTSFLLRVLHYKISENTPNKDIIEFYLTGMHIVCEHYDKLIFELPIKIRGRFLVFSFYMKNIGLWCFLNMWTSLIQLHLSIVRHECGCFWVWIAATLTRLSCISLSVIMFESLIARSVVSTLTKVCHQ